MELLESFSFFFNSNKVPLEAYSIIKYNWWSFSNTLYNLIIFLCCNFYMISTSLLANLILLGEISLGFIFIFLIYNFDCVEFLIQNISREKNLRKWSSSKKTLSVFGVCRYEIVELHFFQRWISHHYNYKKSLICNLKESWKRKKVFSINQDKFIIVILVEKYH